jgi:hypothetical protein
MSKCVCKFDANFKFAHFRPNLHICVFINSHWIRTVCRIADAVRTHVRIWCQFIAYLCIRTHCQYNLKSLWNQLSRIDLHIRPMLWNFNICPNWKFTAKLWSIWKSIKPCMDSYIFAFWYFNKLKIIIMLACNAWRNRGTKLLHYKTRQFNLCIFIYSLE